MSITLARSVRYFPHLAAMSLLTGCVGLQSIIDNFPPLSVEREASQSPTEVSNESNLAVSGRWSKNGVLLEKVKPQVWLDKSDQALLHIVCGHTRRWERPGVNLESLRPLQGDPFMMPDPNQLVAAQTWFWSVQLSGIDPLVAQSRYLREANGSEGYSLTELWEIKEIGFSAANKYVFDNSGRALRTQQVIHPLLPKVELTTSGEAICER